MAKRQRFAVRLVIVSSVTDFKIGVDSAGVVSDLPSQDGIDLKRVLDELCPVVTLGSVQHLCLPPGLKELCAYRALWELGLGQGQNMLQQEAPTDDNHLFVIGWTLAHRGFDPVFQALQLFAQERDRVANREARMRVWKDFTRLGLVTPRELYPGHVVRRAIQMSTVAIELNRGATRAAFLSATGYLIRDLTPFTSSVSASAR